MDKISESEKEFVAQKTKTFFFSTMGEISSKNYDESIFINILGSSMFLFLNTIVSKSERKQTLEQLFTNLTNHPSINDE